MELYFLQDALELAAPLNLRNEAAAVSLLLTQFAAAGATGSVARWDVDMSTPLSALLGCSFSMDRNHTHGCESLPLVQARRCWRYKRYKRL